jgi:hypothetical protein
VAAFAAGSGHNCLVSHVRRIQLALLAVLGVVVAGSIGYLVLGFGLLDAVYQTVTTITTVGFREVHPLGVAGKIFTITLIGVGWARRCTPSGWYWNRWWRVICTSTSKGAGWNAA